LVIRGTLCSIRKQYSTETVLLTTLYARQFAVVERTLCRVITKFGKNTNYPSQQIICAMHTPYFLRVILSRTSREICANFIALKQTLPLLWTTVNLHFGYLTTMLPPSDLHAKQKQKQKQKILKTSKTTHFIGFIVLAIRRVKKISNFIEICSHSLLHSISIYMPTAVMEPSFHLPKPASPKLEVV